MVLALCYWEQLPISQTLLVCCKMEIARLGFLLTGFQKMVQREGKLAQVSQCVHMAHSPLFLCLLGSEASWRGCQVPLESQKSCLRALPWAPLRAEQNSRSGTGGGAVEGSLCLLLVRDKSGERPEFMGFLPF